MKRLCPIHGMWERTEQTTRCPKCAGISSREYDKNYRNKEADKFYHSKAWKSVRRLVLQQEPTCRMCGALAEMVDHIVPISRGGSKLNRENLQPLCNACHNKKTAKENLS